MFYHVAEDDRSDNDENEFAEEQRLDALAKQGANKEPGPQILANGINIGESSSTELHTDSITNRKQNKKKP